MYDEEILDICLYLVCVMNWQVLFENCSVAVFIPFADAFANCQLNFATYQLTHRINQGCSIGALGPT